MSVRENSTDTRERVPNRTSRTHVRRSPGQRELQIALPGGRELVAVRVAELLSPQVGCGRGCSVTETTAPPAAARLSAAQAGLLPALAAESAVAR